jgi:hypothetical protein
VSVVEEYVRALAAQLSPAQRECLVVLSHAEMARRRFGEDEFDRTVDAEMGLERWRSVTTTIPLDLFRAIMDGCAHLTAETGATKQ